MKKSLKNSATSGNIVFDDDITMTGNNKNFGNTLSDVLTNLQAKTAKLENYLKWIYKYGGVGGTGGGGGGNTSSGYSIYAELNNKQINNSVKFIDLGTSGNYPLMVKISRPGGATYKVTCTFTNSNNVVTNTISDTLTLENSYTLDRIVNITSNGTINIRVTDSVFNETTPLSTKYITDPYKFTGSLVNDNGYTLSNEMFTTTINNGGLNLRMAYLISVDTEVSYKLKITTPSSTLTSPDYVTMQDLLVGENSVYDIDILDFMRKQGYILSEENSGNYSISIELRTKIVGELEYGSYTPINTPISFTSIPETIYLLVQSTTGTLYKTIQDEDDVPAENMFSPGHISFTVRPYFGNLIGTSCEIQYKLGDEAEWTSVFSTFRTPSTVEIYSTKSESVNSISFRLSNTNGSEVYPGSSAEASGEGTYYFYVRSSDFSDGWWHQFSPNTERKVLLNRNQEELTQYFRLDTCSSKFIPILTAYKRGPINQTINKNEVVIDGLSIPDVTDQYFTTIINVGLEYNSINDNDACILEMSTDSGDLLSLYQNGITINVAGAAGTTYRLGDNKLYIPKTDVSNLPKTNNVTVRDYHLITIISRPIDSLGRRGKEVLIYIDGIIEACFPNLLYDGNPDRNLKVSKITIKKVNVNINLLDVTYFPPEKFSEDENYFISEDVTAYQYYLKYKSSLLGEVLTEKERMLLSYYDNLIFDPRTGDVYCTHDDVKNFAENLDIPTMVITVNDPDGNYKMRLGNFYSENSVETLETTASLEWSGLGENKILTAIKFPEMVKSAESESGYINWSNNTRFHIKIQGSSTKGYYIKNYTLSLEDEGGSIYTPLFSPNFKIGDSNTFLPEKSFTLKADVVDSSHSNNTSIGAFVNDITTKFDTKPSSLVASNLYKNYVKNCLTGFPFIIFMRFSNMSEESEDTQGKATYYYHGVYNFNLGRESNYNLGYKDYSVFCDSSGNNLIDNASDNGFSFFLVKNENSVVKNGVITAEIQGNSPFLDFSQFNTTLLFENEEETSEAKTTLFGRVTALNPDDSYIRGGNLDNSDAQLILKGLVENIAYSGGYIFKEIKKSFSTSESNGYGYVGDNQAYNAIGNIDVIDDEGNITNKLLPLNQVPNYRYQFKRTAEMGIVFDKYLEREGTLDDLQDLLRQNLEDESSKIPWLDFNSVSEYYTICMAFGLIDSVQKNLTIKTWTADRNTGRGTFYAAFYDMDTCLGIDNTGKKVNYTAFSDYWMKDESTTGNITTPKSIIIYRDYSPAGDEYFDTASSYLFAIPKYVAYLIRKQGNSAEQEFKDKTANWPRQLWVKWRSLRNNTDHTIGCLESADHFIKTYFSNNLGSVGIPLINANYRAKYLVELYIDATSMTNAGNALSKFNGTRIALTKDWLSNRLHLLDAYFNVISDISNPIMFYREESTVVNGVEKTYYKYTSVSDDNATVADLPEPALPNYGTVSNNPDVYIYSNIFGTVTTSTTDVHATIKAIDYSPLLLTTANKTNRFLIGGNTYYKLDVDISGNQQYHLWGSKTWTYLDSIDGFGFSNKFTINSQYIDQLVGNGNKSLDFDSADITLPSLKTIKLTSPYYTGQLTLDGTKFTNLNSIDLSNSRITLSLSNTTCNELNLSNVSGNSYTISNCNELSSFTCENAYITALTMAPVHRNITTNNTSGFSKLTTGEGAKSAANSNPFGTAGTGFYFNNTHIKVLSLNNKEDTGGFSRLEINGDDVLTTVNVSGFSVIVIRNCPNLSQLYISDPPIGENSGDRLRRLCIDKCGEAGSNLNINTTEIGRLDLSKLTELNFVSFRNCVTISSVKFADNDNTNVYLDYDAFSGDTSLNTIDGKAYIIGSSGSVSSINSVRSTFFRCTKFTLKDSEGNTCKLPVINEATSLISLFSAGNSTNYTNLVGNIELDQAREFVNNYIPVNNNITNIYGLFKNQKISYTKNQLIDDLRRSSNFTCVDMSKFRKVTNVSYAFCFNNITAWHPKMFAFGEDVSTTTIAITQYTKRASSVTVTTVKDVLFDIIDKITVLGNNTGANGFQYTRIELVDYNGTILTQYKATDFFWPQRTVNGTLVTKYPKQVTTLQFISFSSAAIVNFDKLFTGTLTGDNNNYVVDHPWENLKTIYRFEQETANTSNTSSTSITNINGLDKLFGETINYGGIYHLCPPKLEEILDSFRISVTPITYNNVVGQSFVNLFDFFDWEYYSTRRGDFFRREYTSDGYSNYSEGNFSVYKYIYYNRFKELCSILFNSNCNWTGFSHIFKNCTLIMTADEYNQNQVELTNDSNFTMNNVTNIGGLFDGFRVITKNTLQDEVTISDLRESISSVGKFINFNFDRLISIFPKVVAAPFLFRDVKFKKALPFNFWRKRQADAEIKVYIRNSNAIDNSNSNIQEVGKTVIIKYYNDENPNIWKDYFIEANLKTYSYSKELTNLMGCFYNAKWYYDNETENAKNFDPAQLNNYSKNSIYYYDSNDQLVEIITKGARYYTKAVTDTSYGPLVEHQLTFTEKAGGLESSTEFTDIEELTEETVNPNTGITEFAGIGNYSGQVTVRVPSSGPSEFLNNYPVSNASLVTSRALIAPDILYSITSNCSLENIFYSEGTDTLEGMLPRNLLKEVTTENLISGLLTNQSVIPRKFGVISSTQSDTNYEVTYYTFVPDNFISTNSLDGVFKFKILLPDSSTVQNNTTKYNQYYLLLDSSIKNRSTLKTFSNGFPDYTIEGTNQTAGLWRTSEHNYYSNYRSRYNKRFYYGLMFNPVYDSNGVLVGGEEGIDINKFKAAAFHSMLTEDHINRYLGGYLFKSNTDLNEITRNNRNSAVFGSYSYNTSTIINGKNCQRFISRFIMLPKCAMSAENFIYIKEHPLLMYKNQISGGDNISVTNYSNMKYNNYEIVVQDTVIDEE